MISPLSPPFRRGYKVLLAAATATFSLHKTSSKLAKVLLAAATATLSLYKLSSGLLFLLLAAARSTLEPFLRGGDRGDITEHVRASK